MAQMLMLEKTLDDGDVVHAAYDPDDGQLWLCTDLFTSPVMAMAAYDNVKMLSLGDRHYFRSEYILDDLLVGNSGRDQMVAFADEARRQALKVLAEEEAEDA